MPRLHSSLSIFRISVLMFIAVIASSHAQTQSTGQDPDIPDFARYKIDKEEFMKLRSEGIGFKRGVEKDKPFDPHLRIAALKEMEAQQQRLFSLPHSPMKEALLSTWTELGPNPIPNGQVTSGPQLAVSGRTISIAVHPTNPNIVYVGTAQGGLYRSTDGGTNWTPLMDNAMSLAIGALALAPSSPDILYVGTGEPNFSLDSYFGVGVYRIDNASTVTPTITGPLNQDATTADVFTGRAIGNIKVHPTDPATIFVSTTSGLGGIGGISSSQPSRGIYRSTNATSANPTFAKLTGLLSNSNVSVRDIAIDPTNANILIANPISSATNAGGIYRSTNALAADPTTVTFTQTLVINSASTSALTGEFAAIHPVGDADATFYAAMGFSNGRVYRSTDGGASWTQQIDNNFCGGQCFYDIAIAVDPSDKTRVYLGGDPTLAFGISTNSGTSFTASESGLHVDSHVIAVAPSNSSIVYFGSDGGIYKSTDSGANWNSMNNTSFRATQFMGLSVHPIDPNFTIGGTQDNGTNMYRPNGTWNRVDFGDGGYSVIDQSATNTTTVNMFHTYFNATTLQGYGYTSDGVNPTEGTWAFRGCQSGGSTTNGITCNGTILFYAPLEQGPGTPNTIYYGSDRLYRSADNGANHTVVSQNPISSGVPISAIGISPQNDNVRVAGLSNGGLFGTSTGSTTLADLDPSNTIPNNFVARVVIDPNSATTAYVTLSAFGVTNVWKTTNLSATPPTWTAAASGIPAVPVNAFVVDPFNSSNLFAGTDIGVYVSSDGGTSWLPFGTGLPRVAVFDMAIHPLTRTLRIATHGRGMWELNAAPLPVQLASFTATRYGQWHVRLDWRTVSEVNNFGFEVQRGTDQRGPFGTVLGGFVPGNGTTSQPHDYSYVDTTAQPGQWFYRLKQIDLDGAVHYTEAVEINTLTSVFVQTSPTEFGLAQNYPNPFNPSTTIRYALPQASSVLIEVYNTLGAQVATLVDGRQEAGYHDVSFTNASLPSGVYYYRLRAGNETITRKMVLMK